jgi:GNAT superfamily N-acetyltransferase
MSPTDVNAGVDGAREQSAHGALVREATEDDAATLTGLCVRSKAHWGYDAEFMADALDDLTVSPEYVRRNRVRVAEVGGEPAAFYSLKRSGGEIELDSLFVEPRFMGRGLGKFLLLRAADEARRSGYARMLVVSDPFAEGFYLACGARRIGEVPSRVRPGRALPLLEFQLRQ